ncbi:bifunctional DNA primase/polymerase [Microcoleus sp. Pol11C2]|uniref:bifunctional DNA primase/polymerase n=1 Tax=Microcoleus sp. Pol11C2 TaxID=3055389 RepID=UPI002FD38F5E
MAGAWQMVCISQSQTRIPESWPRVPLRGKRPYKKGWVDRHFSHSEILTELETGKATGVGVKLGKGLLAIDFDGNSAADALKKFAGENGLQDFATTTSWTSGRPGRKQCLFRVEEKDWPRLRNLRIGTGVTGDDGKEEGLELRWQGWQSVLPPSLHPLTGQPYTWINDPAQHPPAIAPEWLISLCENWHTEYGGEEELDLIRFPARLYKHFGRPLTMLLLARRFDNSRQSHGGKNKGSGVGSFTLLAASRILNRSTGHIRKLLRAAKVSGLIRNYKQCKGWITVWYSSLEKAIALAGLEELGPIAAINIDQLSNIYFIATEVEAQALQRASMHRQRQEEIEQIKAEGGNPQLNPSQIVKPIDLHTCDYPARVLGKGDRFVYCTSEFRFYGGSQEAIAKLRGISPATVSRHLSNKYRLKPTPVRGYRQDAAPIVKKQLLQQLPQLQNMPPKLCAEDGLFWIKDNYWKPHCNVYLLDYRLISARRRRRALKAAPTDNICLLKISAGRGDLEDKAFLSSFDLKAEEYPTPISNRRQNFNNKPEQGKAKMIMPQQ